MSSPSQPAHSTLAPLSSSRWLLLNSRRRSLVLPEAQ
ncbi:hypothetical protein CORC01_07302 [Colletotrichum orchidophilum]|uniref:Uncharacterized protein n=1 Tax=Colletotrichum orchidophilum TaxID=1209926 RepID=A0A1G4B7K3_9PEZI|nr:uncharacterized protein CORC01_07302 [Colletotrichum orchidophilum]OHE97397.1 hypothetical protein CORC01_07302 [Colletotrichum orchidophilum]